MLKVFDLKFKSNPSKTFVLVEKLLTKLKALEFDWNLFLTTVDPEVAESDRKMLAEGESVPGTVNLVNAR